MNMISFAIGVAMRHLMLLGDASDELKLIKQTFEGRHGAILKTFFETWPWRREVEREVVEMMADSAGTEAPGSRPEF